MSVMIESAVQWLLALLALPDVGLSAVFLISLLSATLLPGGSEPMVFAVIKANAALFWPVLAVATFGNTIGGVIGYWMGYGAQKIAPPQRDSRWFNWLFGWLQRFGPKLLLLSWLPVIGDPLSALAGWLRLPFWACVGYMALGKFLRYLLLSWALVSVPDSFWRQLLQWW
jgi:membrane protein YqaA with SNARE-associated domain